VLDGQLDEVVLSNVAKSAEQIAQGYKMSKDNYITKDISAIDLSDKSALSFYIASDRPGSFLQASLGETQFVNNLNDPNTIALYKFDEHTNDACNGGVNDVCDSSGAGAHGNVSSTPLIVPGIVGNARDFDGTDDKVNVPFTGFPATLSNITISF